MKRIVLFLLTNLAVMLLLSVTLSVLGVRQYLDANGINYASLLVYSLVVGFTGAIVSLLLSKPMAKWSTGARVIDTPRNSTEAWLVQTVQRLAQKARIGMPEVAIYEGEPNAFATGAFRDSSLVAVSTGLLSVMDQDEVEAVLGHEVAHVANGDMVTLTLLQGVMNTFVVFFARVVGFLVDNALSRSEERRSGMGYYLTVMVFEVLFGLLASLIVMWFSRHREYRADRGAAEYLGSTRPMESALARLGSLQAGELPRSFRAAGINSMPSFMELFSSHPPLEKRIQALQALRR